MTRKSLLGTLNHWRVLTIAVLVLGTLLAGLGFTTSVLLVVSILFYALWLHGRYSIVFVFSLVLSIVSYAIAGSLLMHVLYIANIPIDFSVLYILLSLPIYGFIIKTKNNPFPVRFSWSDILHVTFIVASLLILAWPMIGATPSKIVEFLRLGGGEDSSSQMQMYHYVLKENRFAYNNTYNDTGIRESLTSYPQGSHAAMVVITKPFMTSVNENKISVVVAYGLGLMSMYITIFYLLYAVISHYLKSTKRRLSRWVIELGFGVLIMAVGVFGIFLSLLTHSFMGQIAAYLGIMLIITYLWLSSGLANKKEDRINLGTCFTGLILGFFLVFSSWYLVAPIAAIACLAFLVVNFRWACRNMSYIGISLATLSIVCGYLAYVYLFTSTDSGHILTPAGVDKLSIYYFLLTIPIAVLGVQYFKEKRWMELTVVVLILMAVGFAALIGVYQIKKIGHLEYYFYKSIYTILIISMILLFYQVVVYVRGFIDDYKGGQLQLSAIVVTGIISLIVSAPVVSKPIIDYSEMKYGVLEVERKRILDLTLEDDTQYADVLFIGACDKYLNFLGTIWSGSLHLGYLDDRGRIESAFLRENGAKLKDRLIKYANDTNGKIKVYVIGECDQKLVQELVVHNKYVVDTRYKDIQP